MNADDRAVFAKCLFVLAEVFGEHVSDVRAEAYFHALRDLPVSVVTQTMTEAIRACTFFPRPAELRRLAGGTSEDRAELAWVEARRLASKVGAYQRPELLKTDNAMAAAIGALGGWRSFCLAEEGDLRHCHMLFKQTYVAQHRRDELARALDGVGGNALIED